MAAASSSSTGVVDSGGSTKTTRVAIDIRLLVRNAASCDKPASGGGDAPSYSPSHPPHHMFRRVVLLCGKIFPAVRLTIPQHGRARLALPAQWCWQSPSVRSKHGSRRALPDSGRCPTMVIGDQQISRSTPAPGPQRDPAGRSAAPEQRQDWSQCGLRQGSRLIRWTLTR